MKITLLAIIFAAAAVAGCATKSKTAGTPAAPAKTSAGTNVLSDDKARASYAVGMVFAHNLQQQNIEVDTAMLLRGFKDEQEQAGTNTLLTPQAAQAAIRSYQEKTRAEQVVKNKTDQEAFLATNKNNPGVITLPDGLQYKVIAEGTGAMPTADATVTVNYRGTFLDGKEFDSSARAGHPAQFQAGNVIHGWTEALTKMKVGSKWRLFIPSDLAYGPQGRPPIPPNAMLIFDVELLDVKNPETPAAKPVVSSPAAPAPTPLTSDVVAVPSAEEISKGKKPYTIKQEDLEKMQSQVRTN